ncbi:phosphotransferase enzyme family protein [Gaoshiqia sp. Z1-71]|uniref:phosphotransferase enzyme family protein n=1 Tax=Gaoshiqia hydrogeniformans TaxID=3290090 RepID=UPI003BF8CD5F
MNKNEIVEIALQFAIQGEIAEVRPFGSGHIHETFRVGNTNAEFPDYVLQKINSGIFTNIDHLMDNIRQVINHLHTKKGQALHSNPDEKILELIPTLQGKSYYKHPDGSYWRLYVFLKNTKSYDLVEREEQALEGGRAFGKFISLLSDLNPQTIHEILPNFHNIEFRLGQLRDAKKHDPKNRLQEVEEEVAFVQERAERMSLIKKMGDEGKLPLRITHNDTKFNNVLLNENDQAVCVIDLDTVMPGYVAYDFGDAVRTIINTAEEDEKDLEKIQLNLNLFKAYAEGFISETSDILNEHELDSLSQSCLLLPFIMGVRFLTDYIDGDHYYRIHFPDHNIQRARAQFQLVRKIEQQFEVIQATIKQLSSTQKTRNPHEA